MQRLIGMALAMAVVTGCTNAPASASSQAVVPTPPATLIAPASEAPSRSATPPATLAAPTSTTEPPNALPTLPSDALSQMEIAFVGNPRQALIRDLLDRAFVIYELEWNEENLSRAGSVLVALRQDAEASGSDLSEIAILEAMVADGGLPGFSFPDAAAWMATALRLDQ